VTNRAQWMLVGAIVAALGVGGFVMTRAFGADANVIGVGSRAPGFIAQTIDATPAPRSLTDYRGKVVVLNVWATWCGPCRKEMPSFQRLWEDYKERDLAIVAVSVDLPGKEDDIRAFVDEFGLTFDILHDPQSNITAIYRTTGYPETFVIAKDGTIRKKWIGDDDWSSPANRRFIEQLLAEPAS
jgi:peroxiredoxin